ncbi:manganese transport system membrane protein MntC [Thiosulfatimonas sediminis]|uniref:Manganese transport system membrane protein MntC n=1 Tax=Thiosulfatimonas sediminis TaxID=2675054 RepID=A0A6F8PWM1_9GAMM|nr:iron chelate uptake ABC transporter family permease subunit [Thiosulfatimonas sediminis]BBP46404.1 manganese transport system membrane protein MntC [Thiosulfatimonas sediminis]
MNAFDAYPTTDFISQAWHHLQVFWSFEDINATWVLFGSLLLGMSASVIGAFAFLRKRSLLGDALAHAALPGVMMAFLLSGSRDAEVIFVGALASSLIGFWIIDWLPKNTKIKPDAALAITLSFFFALGLMLLSYIQNTDLPDKSGLDKLLFGQAAAITSEDIQLLIIVTTLVLLTVLLFFQKLRLITFNRSYAKTLGINVKFYEMLLAIMIVLSVVVGLQLVGVVLMAAILLTPIAAARFWSHQLSTLLMLAALFGAISAILGAQISYVAPAMPTGPWIVVSLSLLFFISFLVAPKQGLLKRYLEYRRLKQRVILENILRTLYKLLEREHFQRNQFTLAEITELRSLKSIQLKQSLAILNKRKLVIEAQQRYSLSEEGLLKAIKLTRRHRLWESYLSQHADLNSEQVHQQAERIEHILNKEQEQQIVAELMEQFDPHGSPIPKLPSQNLQEKSQ